MRLGSLFGGMGTYAKAVVAFVGAFGTFLVTILAEQSVTHVLPPTWVVLLGTVASALTGVATYAKRNKVPDVRQPEPVSEYEWVEREPERGVTPGSIVDHVIDTARGTIGNILI